MNTDHHSLQHAYAAIFEKVGASYRDGKRHSKLTADEVAELTQLTHFNPKELNQWYRGFLQDCPSGSMMEEEFCRIYRQYFPFGSSDILASLIFKAFPPEKDGTVGFKQFVVNLSVVLRGSTDETLKWIFNLMDRDRDGYLSKDEVTRLVDAIYKMVGNMVELPPNSLQNRVNNLFLNASE
eukprot:Em0016g1171a